MDVIRAPTKNCQANREAHAFFVQLVNIPINPFKQHANRAVQVNGRMKVASPRTTNVKVARPEDGPMQPVATLNARLVRQANGPTKLGRTKIVVLFAVPEPTAMKKEQTLHVEIVPEILLSVTSKTAPSTMNSPTAKNARQVNMQNLVIRSVTRVPLDVILKLAPVLAEIVRQDTKVWTTKQMIHRIAFVVTKGTTSRKLQNNIVYHAFVSCL